MALVCLPWFAHSFSMRPILWRDLQFDFIILGMILVEFLMFLTQTAQFKPNLADPNLAVLPQPILT